MCGLCLGPNPGRILVRDKDSGKSCSPAPGQPGKGFDRRAGDCQTLLKLSSSFPRLGLCSRISCYGFLRLPLMRAQRASPSLAPGWRGFSDTVVRRGFYGPVRQWVLKRRLCLRSFTGTVATQPCSDRAEVFAQPLLRVRQRCCRVPVQRQGREAARCRSVRAASFPPGPAERRVEMG